MILFRELLLLAVGRREALSEAPSAADWQSAWHLAKRQQLQAVLYDAACCLPEGVRPPAALDEVWRKSADSVAVMSELNYKLCCELDSMLKTAGVRTCVLKGQALASYYPRPASRFGGDIDLWIDLGHRAFVKKARAEGWKLSDIVYQECSLSYSRSVNVDVHFRPARMYNPFRNRRLQAWFSAQAPLQFDLPSGGERPFAVPTAGFNAVYLCVHIFRHAVDGGVALRQILDYYYVLKALTPEERREAFDTLCSAGIGRFVGELMHVLVICLRLRKICSFAPLIPSPARNFFTRLQPGAVAAAGAARHASTATHAFTASLPAPSRNSIIWPVTRAKSSGGLSTASGTSSGAPCTGICN